MGVAVSLALALAPLPVRGQEVESVRGGHRPRHARLVVAHVESGRGLLTAIALGVEALGRVVIGLDPRIDIGHAVTALDVSGLGLLIRDRSRRERARSPARRRERRDRSRSHASSSRSVDRSRSMEQLSASSSRLRDDGAARRARRGIQEGVEAVASQPAVVPGGSADVTPVAGGTSMTALPSAMKELARFFLNLSLLLFPGSVWRLCGSDRFWSGVGGSCGSLFVSFWSGHILWYGGAACGSWRFA